MKVEIDITPEQACTLGTAIMREIDYATYRETTINPAFLWSILGDIAKAAERGNDEETCPR